MSRLQSEIFLRCNIGTFLENSKDNLDPELGN